MNHKALVDFGFMVYEGLKVDNKRVGDRKGISVHARRHVNRKALDQYAAFTDQRAELARRQEENARGETKIKQLIDTLDLRKDEAIERTFKVGFFTRTWVVHQNT